MGRKSKKFLIDQALEAEIVPTATKIEEVPPKSLLYVIVPKFSRMYKALFPVQFKNGEVKKMGNIKIDNIEFELGKTYEVAKTLAIDKALRDGLLMASGKLHFKG